jgi:hypothetical protein
MEIWGEIWREIWRERWREDEGKISRGKTEVRCLGLDGQYLASYSGTDRLERKGISSRESIWRPRFVTLQFQINRLRHFYRVHLRTVLMCSILVVRALVWLGAFAYSLE